MNKFEYIGESPYIVRAQRRFLYGEGRGWPGPGLMLGVNKFEQVIATWGPLLTHRQNYRQTWSETLLSCILLRAVITTISKKVHEPFVFQERNSEVKRCCYLDLNQIELQQKNQPHYNVTARKLLLPHLRTTSVELFIFAKCSQCQIVLDDIIQAQQLWRYFVVAFC